MSRSATRLAAIGIATPDVVRQDELWEAFFSGRGPQNRLAQAAFAGAGVRTRHAAFDPRSIDVSDWSTERRMEHYVEAAFPLAEAAAARALERGAPSEPIGLLVVASCTGHATPGLDVLLADALGLGGDTRRLVIGHLGCHAALPALATADDFVTATGRPALVVSVELSSLHLQPADVPHQEAVNALFGDAAAAVVLTPASGGAEPPALAVLGHNVASDLGAADLMTWQIGSHGFRMGLSRKVPEHVGALSGPLVDALLAPHGLERRDVAAWAVHPGGPRVLSEVAAALGLGQAALAPSAGVLAGYGNCSSATVLIVLDAVTHGNLAPGAPVVMVAFGPGLTGYATLLRAGGTPE
ncbi:MAG: type III polyketide synthase [Actinomycetota bacterium]|nr:type III polyketide synthase [Actinomycetota bacterium]